MPEEKLPPLKGRIKKIESKHLEKVKKLLRESREFNRQEKIDYYTSIRHYLENPEGIEYQTYLFLDKDDIAGLMSIGKGMGNKTYDLYYIVVSPKYKGRHVGSQLIDFAEKIFRKNAARIVIIETSSKNEYLPARRLYEKKGYHLSGIVQDYFDEGDDKIIYSKKL